MTPRHYVLAAGIFALVGATILLSQASTPATAAGTGPSMAAITAGDWHTCGLTTSGQVWCWGEGGSGQIGNGSVADSAVPKTVTGISAGDFAAAGSAHSCVILESGGLKCWGRNQYGKLGNGSASGTNSNTPVDVSGLTSGVAAAAPGTDHTCALTTGGGVKCWGDNGYVQLGNLSGMSSSVPIDVPGLISGMAGIASGGYHSCALTTGGGVKCWGYNVYGQVGNGAFSASSGPVDVSGLTSGVIAVSAGEYHSCALLAGGSVKCWGAGGNGQLGDGNQSNSNVPVDVSGLSGVTAIDGGGAFTCALTTGGGVKCWGNDTSGQLGNGAAGVSLTPVDVSGLTAGVASIATGFEHACAVTTLGVAKCWGANGVGQLGNGNNDPSDVPIDITFEDIDGDGCTDAQENQTGAGSETTGGRRDAKNFWDFFDVPTGGSYVRDRSISAQDIFAVVGRFNAAGVTTIDPLSTPSAAPNYHTAYDRGPSLGPNPWNLGPANGSIASTDIFAVLGQFGHACA